MQEWKDAVKAAHEMIYALCQPRGSEGSRQWIMSIPAREDHDPDLVITSGLMAAEKQIATLTAERDRLAAENAAANATLDRLREVWEKYKTPRDDLPKIMRDKMECMFGPLSPLMEDFRAILYPTETPNDDR